MRYSYSILNTHTHTHTPYSYSYSILILILRPTVIAVCFLRRSSSSYSRRVSAGFFSAGFFFFLAGALDRNPYRNFARGFRPPLLPCRHRLEVGDFHRPTDRCNLQPVRDVALARRWVARRHWRRSAGPADLGGGPPVLCAESNPSVSSMCTVHGRWQSLRFCRTVEHGCATRRPLRVKGMYPEEFGSPDAPIAREVGCRFRGWPPPKKKIRR